MDLKSVAGLLLLLLLSFVHSIDATTDDDDDETRMLELAIEVADNFDALISKAADFVNDTSSLTSLFALSITQDYQILVTVDFLRSMRETSKFFLNLSNDDAFKTKWRALTDENERNTFWQEYILALIKEER